MLPLGGSGGSVVVPPPVPLEGLELWFDATQGVTETEGRVSDWKDRSPRGRHATQEDGALRPVLGAEALNGKPSVVFDGTDDFLMASPLVGDFSAGVTVIVVGQTDSDEALCMGYFEACNGPEQEDVHLGFWQQRYLYEVATPYLHLDYAQVVRAPEVLVALHRPTGDVEVRRNAQVIGESKFELPVVAERKYVYLGQSQYEGCTVLNGRISELLVYSRGMSTEELEQVEGYLQQKWACCQE